MTTAVIEFRQPLAQEIEAIRSAAGARRDRFVILTALLAYAIGCGSSSPTTPSNPGVDTRITLTPVAETAEWPASTPEAERLDSRQLSDAVNRIRRGEFGRINSLLIARPNRLVVEESSEIARQLGGRPATYGYLWWGLPGGVVTASGARGQWIFALRDQRLIVVSTAENGGGQESAAARLLDEYVMPAGQ